MSHCSPVAKKKAHRPPKMEFLRLFGLFSVLVFAYYTDLRRGVRIGAFTGSFLVMVTVFPVFL